MKNVFLLLLFMGFVGFPGDILEIAFFFHEKNTARREDLMKRKTDFNPPINFFF